MGTQAKMQESFVSVYLMTAGNWKIASKSIFQKHKKSSLMDEGCLIYDFQTERREEEREKILRKKVGEQCLKQAG